MLESVENYTLKVKMERLKLFIKFETLKYLLSTLLLTSGFFFMAYAIITWWPKVLVTIYGVTLPQFSLPMMIGSLIQVPVIFLVGYISESIGRKKTSILFASLTLISLLIWFLFIAENAISYGNIWTWTIMDGYLFIRR